MAPILLALLLAQQPPPPDDDANRPVFGVTVVDAQGFQGKIYKLKPGTRELPNLSRMKPIGTIYTRQLDIAPRNFTAGFPGVTDLNEWFALDYTGKFYIETPGKYKFSLLSDDGSKLYIDKKLVIDNDGTHAALTIYGAAQLKTGHHTIRVSYFQGPRTALALVLRVAFDESHEFKIFNMRDFYKN